MTRPPLRGHGARRLLFALAFLALVPQVPARAQADPDDPPHRARSPGMGSGTFLSPMGEPFRGPGGRAGNARRWFDGADTDHDGRLTLAEMQADASRFFATLDVDNDGEIGPDEIERYEREVAPEVRVGGGPGGERMRMGSGGHHGGGEPHGDGGGGRSGGGRRGGGTEGSHEAASPGEPAVQGAGRYGYLALPEPVIGADADFNRGVSRAEFLAAAQRRFLLLDAGKEGALTFAALPRLR